MDMNCVEKDNSSSSVIFRSYVIYDLETTTLPCFGIPKITELSAVGVIRDHIENLAEGKIFPRVLNKLTLCIYPRKLIALEAERLTGLSNELLEDLSPFNESIFTTLENFIHQMPPPICMIAHNGKCFDFPILQSEVQGIGKKFADNLWCADSLPAFRYLYLEQPKESFIASQRTEISRNVPSASGMENIVDELELDDFDLMLCDALDSAEKVVLSQKIEMQIDSSSVMVTPTKHNQLSPCRDNSGMDFVVTPSAFSGTSSAQEMQKINETTPKRPLGQFTPKVAKCAVVRDHNYYSPRSAKNGVESERLKKKLPVKRLTEEFHKSHTARPKSFKLTDIYQYVCGKEPINAHSAESDTSMLLQCIVGCRRSFLVWVDENAVPFNRVKKLW